MLRVKVFFNSFVAFAIKPVRCLSPMLYRMVTVAAENFSHMITPALMQTYTRWRKEWEMVFQSVVFSFRPTLNQNRGCLEQPSAVITLRVLRRLQCSKCWK